MKQSPVPGTTTPLPKGLPRLCVMQIRLPSLSATESEVVEIVRQVCAGRTAIGASVQRLLKTVAESIALTDREHAVLQALARGHTNASAAESLGISPKTVDTHRTSLMRKFAVNSTASLLLAAVRAGVLDASGIR